MLVACSLVAAAGAGTTPISYPDFSSVAGLTLNGNAVQSGSALRLAANAPLQHGSAWAQTQIDTTQSFESRFRAVVHDGSFFPADGMTFTIQSQGLSALGDNGGAHGFASSVGAAISPSVALDVSVYPQSSQGANEQFAIAANGSLQSPLAKAASPVLLYGQPFSAWVDYDAKAHTLQVFVGQTTAKPAAPLVSTSVDLAGAVGPAAYAGFTAGTGGLDADFDVLGWTVENVGDSTPPTVACAASPSVLWPPNNKLVPVTTKVAVTDSGSGAAGFSLVSVTSNEGNAAAESSGWAPGTPDTSGFLQASRLGSGQGRVYTLTYEGRDNAGNKATCATTVAVPHDQGKS
jgi:Legume lectin domain